MTTKSTILDDVQGVVGDPTPQIETECVNCGNPIILEGYYAKMVEFLNMPKRSGLCSRCVNNSKVQEREDSHNQKERKL
jgi:hypothetical protein